MPSILVTLSLLTSAMAITINTHTTDVKGNAYATAPWNATFLIDLDGKAGGKQSQLKIRVHPEWAPEGAKRFQDLVEAGLLTDARFFRVVPNFMVQFGIPAKPGADSDWKTIPDDKVLQSNKRGMVTFATSGPNSRTTQIFINYKDNSFLDGQGFSPFAEVVGEDGMKIADKIQAKYRESPNQGAIKAQGNQYLQDNFPDLSFISDLSSAEPFTKEATSFLQKKKQSL